MLCKVFIKHITYATVTTAARAATAHLCGLWALRIYIQVEATT